MKITYDPDVDAAYIYLRPIKEGEAKHHSVELTGENSHGIKGELIADYSNIDGKLIGIEILGASSVLPAELLKPAIKPGEEIKGDLS